MKITFICAVFPPEPAPSGVMAKQLAGRLAQDGHEVSMIVPFPNRPEGVVYPGYSRKLRTRSVTPEGYTLIRCANWLIGKKRRHVNRILEGITFGLSSTWAAWREGRPDFMIIESWPLFGAEPPASLALLWRVPFLKYVQDVYPETAEEAGIIPRGGAVANALRRWDRSLCARSSKVIVISETMRDLMVSGRDLSPDRFIVIPNWLDESKFATRIDDGSWRKSQNICEDDFVAMFSGTLGHVSGADILVEAAQILRYEANFLLLCVGEGVKKEAMRREALRLGLDNIRFLPFQPIERVPEMQASSNVALLTMEPNHANASVPSKLISYLAASRPVIVAADPRSAVARTVLSAEAGIVVPPGNSRALANAILQIRRDPAAASQMGLNARRCFEENYTLHRAYQQFSEILNATIDPEAPPQTEEPGRDAPQR